MWPYSIFRRTEHGRLNSQQAVRVTHVYYTERDIGCWFACAAIPNDREIRVATSTRDEARACAESLAAEVFRKAGRTVEVQDRA